MTWERRQDHPGASPVIFRGKSKPASSGGWAYNYSLILLIMLWKVWARAELLEITEKKLHLAQHFLILLLLKASLSFSC